MTTNKKSKYYRLEKVPVHWANLFRPDEFRGSKKHDVTVIISQSQYDEMLSLAGVERLAGVRVGEQGDILCKAKSTVFTRQGEDVYQNCFDSAGNQMKPLIGKSDVVNVNVGLYEYSDGLYTITLGGVQLIEKHSEFGAGDSDPGSRSAPFAPVEGGYVAGASDRVDEESSSPAPSSSSGSSDEIPF